MQYNLDSSGFLVEAQRAGWDPAPAGAEQPEQLPGQPGEGAGGRGLVRVRSDDPGRGSQ